MYLNIPYTYSISQKLEISFYHWKNSTKKNVIYSMDIPKAKEIVRMLANGVNPLTGDVFPPESHYNNPEIIRALFTVLESVKSPAQSTTKALEEKQQDNIENMRPKNAGLPWNVDQKKEVAELYAHGKTIKELAEYFGRTYGAIRSELKRQGLLE